MEKEFIPMDLALRMKRLGFNDKCFRFYWENSTKMMGEHSSPNSNSDLDNLSKTHLKGLQGTSYCALPTYSQSFRWFRGKYNLHPIVSFDKFIDEDDNDVELDEPYFTYYYSINELWDNTKDYNKFVRGFVNVASSRGIMSQEDAELACLTKLIEIVESKTK